jgi:hypothetical protein
MAAPRLAKHLSALKHRGKACPPSANKRPSRRLQLEPLEDRRMLALGPMLVAVVPNNGVFLHTNDTLNVAPRDLTFRFAQGNAIDPATLATGVKLTSGGPDHILGDADDQTLTPGFLGLGDTPREVIMRFAANLPDNVYSVTLVGSGLTPLKDTSGNPYSSGDLVNLDSTIKFTLDLGAKVDAIVPQPISRNTVSNVLTQKNDTIDVYFDQPMGVSSSDPARATNPAFYRLIDATSGAITLPQSVTYSEDATLSVLSAGMTTLSYNGVSATAPLTIANQTTRVSLISAGTNNKGTFTLTVNGATSAAIPALGATATNVLNAISALPGMAGNVAVTATTGVGTVEQFDITFQGALTGRSVSVLFSPAGGAIGSATNTAFASNLPASGGSGAAASIQNNLASIPALAGKVSVTGPSGGPYTIQFTGALAGTNVAPIIATTTSTLPPPVPPAPPLPPLPSIVSITSQPKASLVFAAAIPPGTQKLEIGTSPEPRVLETTSNAQHLGNSMTTPLQAFLGDSLLLSGSAQANDVDLYRFDLQNAVGNFAVTVTPRAGSTLDTQIRIFDSTGTPLQAINSGAAGTADVASGVSLGKGTYYVGVSSIGNSNYNAATGVGASGGTTTGSYSLQVTFSDLPFNIDDTFAGANSPANIDNSSFDTASAVGTLGSTGRTLGGTIAASPNPLSAYTIDYPGSGDAPGSRLVQYIFNSHIQTPAGVSPDPTPGVEEITYDFQSFYGYTPQGSPLFNAITETQKQRAREAFELIAHYTGIQFREVDPLEDGSVPANISVVTGDVRAIGPLDNVTSVGTHDGFPSIPANQQNNPLNSLLRHEFTVISSSSSFNWGSSEFGGQWFINALNVFGRAIGMGYHDELPDLTPYNQSATSNLTEHIFPSSADVLFEQALHRPESNDIDLYKFTVTEPGLYRAETIAERLAGSTAASPNLLNTVLTLYQETTDPQTGVKTRTEIARNDDYYGNDSYLELSLGAGTYYVAVTSTGNTEFDPTIPDTGAGGRTQGAYSLTMSLRPDTATTSMRDATGVNFDGDADGNAGGRNQFWFQSNTPAPTSAIFYVDKVYDPVKGGASDGSLAKPYTTLSAALAAANTASKAKNPDLTLKFSTIVVRVEGNGGADGVVSTLSDDQAYLVGFKDPNLLQPLPDGGDFKVPQNTTVMMDAGAIFKMRRSNLNAGTTPQGLVSQAGASIQVLGTPTTPVRFTSYADTTMDTGHSAGAGSTPQGGDYGGIAFRDDSDHERDFLSPAGSAANPSGLTMPVFLNYVNNAAMTYAGGKVTVDTVQDQYDPITMNKARPTLTYNTITRSGHAGMSATPNTFDDDGLNPSIPFSQRRIGPDIHDNTIQNNSINGLFISIATQAGSPLDYVDLTTRWKATDIVYVVQESLVVAGTPGGSIFPGTPNSTANAAPIQTILEDGRLRIDPGVTVKLSSRIETKISSQFIAEGTTTLPIIFTSLKDDKYGAGGSFDTNNDGTLSGPAPGQWGGMYFGPASTASLDHVSIMYAGGVSPIEGSFANFNAIDVEQADLRLTNSILKNNAGGGNPANNNRNGRGTNADAVIFVRGAQPIIVNNIIRDNSVSVASVMNGTGPAISINANAMTSDVEGDYGRSTGGIDRFKQYDDNRGPLVRGNRLLNNTLNGMRVREETLTTETIWDDTDIAHIVLGEIIADNLSVYGGLRLQSSPAASLVVKLRGANAGLTASGTPLDISDRIGGTVQVIGQPGFPVVLTGLSDDSVAAGFDPSGLPVFDTDNGAPSTQVLPTGPEVNNGTLIDDDVPANVVGHFETRPLPGGQITAVGATVGGTTGQLINQNAAFIYVMSLDVGGQLSNLSSSNVTMLPTLVAPDLVVSEGAVLVPGTNQEIDWHVETRLNNGVATIVNAVTLSSSQPLGNATLVNFFDPNILFGTTSSNTLLRPVGTPGQANFRLQAIDNTQRIGLAQGGVYQPGPGLVNATYAGYAADRFPSGVGNTGTTYSVSGNVQNLPTLNDPQLGAVYGPAHPETAMAWNINPAAFSATVTTFLDLIATNPARPSAEWRSINLDQNSNDTNVAEVLESEPAYVGVTGSLDNNRAPSQAQFLGALAPNDKSGDDTRRLGFQVDGMIAADHAADVDVYSFTADSGTEVWFDIDRTSAGLDAMLELVDADGNVIASATNTALGNPVVTPTEPPVVTEQTLGSATDNEVQQISLGTPAGATAYNFQLAYTTGGTTFKTGPIVSTATAATVQAALLAIPAFGAKPAPFVAGDLTVNGPAGGPWTVTFGGNFANVPVALLSGGNLPLPGLNANITPGVPEDVGLAQSFDKDYSNGRDTYSTNAGGLVPAATGTITAVSNAFPSVITSPNHGLASGDQVQIGNTRYTVQVLDPNTFALKNASTGFNAGATWTKLVQTTRDPIMRVVLPNAANGTPLKNSPFFLRVRSQPAPNQLGPQNGESGNTLNPGLTSGQYQLQIRVNQQDQKPGSTVRFADIRFATNGIEVHGLPQHSPLAGETAEADTANNSAGNDAQSGAQFLGNLLVTDKNTISVGGQISSLNDVDWYQFDLNAPLTQIFGGGLTSFATMFDIDYADGLARPDTTISVFDSSGSLIYVGRDGSNQADQPGASQGLNADDLSRGSFGQFDANIGSVQLPAGKTTANGPFRPQTYYVAVSTSRNLPTALDQTFNQSATAANVRLEPIDSLGRIVEDHLNGPFSSQTAGLADNQYIDPTTGAARSTFFDLADKKTLGANVQPFNLGDVSLFVSQAGFNGTNQTHLSIVNPMTGIRDMDVGTLDSGTVEADDLTMRGDGTLWAYESVFTGNPTGQAGNVYQVDPTTGAMTLLGSDGITDQPTPPTNPPTNASAQQITTNRVGAMAWSGRWDSTPSANAARLYLAVDDPATGVSSLYLANWANGSTTLVQGSPWGRLYGGDPTSPLELTAATRATGNTNFGIPGIVVTFQSTAFGGPSRIIHFTSDASMKLGDPPIVNVDGANANDVDVVMNANEATASTTFTFGSSNGGSMQFAAVNPGAAGNAIQFTFSRPIGTQALGPGAPPKIKLVGTTIQITLNATPGSETTGQQLADAINDPANGLTNLVTAQAGGDTTQTFTFAPAPVTLTGGFSATTVQDLVTAINAKAAVGLIASFSPSDTKTGNLVIGKTASRDVALTGSSGSTGFTKGLAFGPDTNTLFGVSTGGQFFQVDLNGLSGFEAGQTGQLIVFAVDVTVPGLRSDVNSPPLSFSGLTRGPINLNNGEFANDFFATTIGGQLVCLDSNGNALQVFDTDGDGVADSSWIQMVEGGQRLGTPMSDITGLAFSPLDFNLWHPTATQGADPGHNITPSPDLNASRTGVAPINPNSNKSFAFNFEKAQVGGADQYNAFPGTANTVTSTVTATVSNQQVPSSVTNATISTSVDFQAASTTTQFSGSQFDTNLSSVDDAYTGLTLKFTGGANFGSSQTITKYVGATKTFTLAGALPSAPGPFDTFDIVVATASRFNGDPSLSTADGAYNGKLLTFTGGALNGQSQTITSYTGATQTFTFAVGFAAPPVNGDTFTIQPANPATASRFDGDASLSNVNRFYNGSLLTFTSGALAGEKQIVSNYLGASHTFIFSTPFSATPSDLDQYTLTISTPVPPEILPDGGQFGVLARNQPETGSVPNSGITLPRTLTQDELLNNPSIADSYNFPGGAYGKLYSDPFSLAGTQASDKPTFYFTYFLDTDNGTAGLGNLRRAMTDSARVFIGPITRVTSTTSNSFVNSITPAKDQFDGGPALSGQDDAYTGQAVQFTSGALSGQAQIVTKYIGATHTFIFGDGFTASPSRFDNFIIGSGTQAWDLVATNDPFQDLSGTSTIEGELPTFLSQSATEMPANPHQQVQELFNAGEWRQARIDLSRYAGFDNLKLRFDFSTAGTVNRTDVRTAGGGLSTNNVFEDPSYGGTFGNLGNTARLQDNQHQGFFIDDFVVGLAGRGEMVTSAPQDATFFNPPAPQQLRPGVLPPAQVTAGPYQLEIRRGTDYGVNFDTGQDRIVLLKTLDVNEQELANNRQVISSPTVGDGFESGTLGGNQFVSWGSSGNAPWSASSAQAATGQFSAASGPIGNGQISGLLATVVTGAGQISFSRSIQSDPGDTLRFYIDGQLAVDRSGNSAEWTGDLGFGTPPQVFSYDISAGRHTFRWTYEKDAAPPTGNQGLDQAFIDDVTFPTPQVGVTDIYDPGSPDYFPSVNQVLHSGSAQMTLPGGGSAFIPNGLLHVGDQNLHRAQGHIQIEQNSIDKSAQSGILIDTGSRDPSTNNPYATVRNLPTLSTDRLVPGVTVTDNVVSNSGVAGITFNGDPNTQTASGQSVPLAAVPFGRIVNNTIYGAQSPFGAGIQVGVNAGPTLLNNIIANTGMGISVSPFSLGTTVIGANLYANNTANASPGVTLGSNAIFLQPTDPLFKDPATRNFYLAPGSQAIDSSLNTLADRPTIAAVKSAVGIPQSPILAPDEDLYGQIRVDDPSQNPPPGLGQNIYKDRGAVERADFSAPTASVSDPLDNDNGHRDRNLAVNDVAIRNENLTQFVLKLSDVGIGINPATVTPSQFKLTREDGVQLLDQAAAQAAGVAPDYQFVFNQSTNEVFFIPAEGIWPLNHTYTITVANTAPGMVDALGNPLPSGVLDLAGNPIAANRDDGTTSFNIFVGILYSFGDAPDPTYPSLLASNGAVHEVVDGFHLGSTVVEKSDATPTPNADGNQNPDGTSSDDGIKFTSLSAGYNTTITVTAAIPAGMTGKLDGWIDYNHDGLWSPNEKVVDHNLTAGAGSLVNGTNTITFIVDANALKGPTFARFRFSSTGVDLPTGFGTSTATVAPDGEVEDYKITIGGAPYQNANNQYDVNNDGLVSPGDALVIINYLNKFGSLSLVPPATPPFTPAGTLDAQGNPVKGQGNYVDVNGTGSMEPLDALIVINYINSKIATAAAQGEGEGAATASSASPIIPPVLYASSSVVVQTQPASSQQPLLVAQGPAAAASTAQDQAILDLQSSPTASDADELRLSTAMEEALPLGPLSESAWDDLLLSLASEQAEKEGKA